MTVTINNFSEEIEYVNRLGFNVKPGFPGWIIASQKRMCDVAQSLFAASRSGYPYTVHFFRKERKFLVDGQVEVDARKM